MAAQAPALCLLLMVGMWGEYVVLLLGHTAHGVGRRLMLSPSLAAGCRHRGAALGPGGQCALGLRLWGFGTRMVPRWHGMPAQCQAGDADHQCSLLQKSPPCGSLVVAAAVLGYWRCKCGPDGALCVGMV